MLRTLALAALVLALAPARAQTPDPTDPARYYPLDIGNVWEYDVTEFGSDVAFQVAIVRDTVIAGTVYAVESYRSRRSLAGPWGSRSEAHVRFDRASATVRAFNGFGEIVWHFGGCPLDAPFGSVVVCMDREQPVSGSLGATFALSAGWALGDGTTVAVDALKTFSASFFATVYAADIGFVRKDDSIEGGSTRLRYARIRGREVGTPMAVASEPPPAPAGLALRSAGRTLVLSARDAGPVRLDLFDALGRRVASVFEGALGTGERRFSLPAVAPGLYVAQAIQGASRASVRVVVVR